MFEKKDRRDLQTFTIAPDTKMYALRVIDKVYVAISTMNVPKLREDSQ